ncbi:MAG TPA: GAF domain-containing sensor histidine kinase [Longimicrobiales bacterium]
MERSLRQLELEVAREIFDAFLTANNAVEVYRLALARLTPLVNASFASIFLRDPAEPSLLKLACAQNWPQSSARFLGQMRIREGRGPTGAAVAEKRAIIVADVFADPSLREWWEPATELGFISLITLPLVHDEDAVGALSFYFDAPRDFAEDELHLLRLIADQLAAVTRRAALLEQVRQDVQQLRIEKQTMESRMREAEDAKRLKDEFLANVSHELRTPLTSIIGYTDLLLDGQAGSLEPRQRTLLTRIDSAADILLRLINDLLELTHLKLGRAQMFTQAADAVLLAKRAGSLAGQPQPRVEFRIEPTEEKIDIVTDGDKVVKVLENLISNAFKFTSAGEVTVRVRPLMRASRPFVEWTVSDTGIGISTEDRDHIFDEFRQVDGSSTRLYGGTGLGLALCMRIAELLGGELTVESEPGRGSTFRFAVPVLPNPS